MTGQPDSFRNGTRQSIKELGVYFENADYTDVKVFEGKKTLREFIAAMLSYYPWWVILLYRIRKVLVVILGLAKQENPAKLPHLQPDEVTFAPGENATFFIVRCGREDRFWMAESPKDTHLQAFFGVVRQPLDGSCSRFYVTTTVYHKHWTGRIYFNLIRPFHHLVVNQMARHAATR